MAQSLELRKSSLARRSHHGTLWQVYERTIFHSQIGTQHQRVARVFTFTDGTNSQPVRKDGRQILQRVHSEIDTSVQQRVFEFLRKHTLAADDRQRLVFHVAR